jgi:carbon monoxide dehydrogenase subunit G
MRIEQELDIAAPIDTVWAFLIDLPAVSRCVPGAGDIRPIDADTVGGTIGVRVGPIGLRLVGRVRLAETDATAHRAALEIEASDRRIGGGMTAHTTFNARPADGSPDATRLSVATDATLTGRLGQFGQPIIRRKSEELSKEFAANVAAALADPART